MLNDKKGGNILNDEEIVSQCLNMQAETIIKPIDELFFNLKHPWMSTHTLAWNRTLQFQVDHLFDSEKSVRKQYPLFDIIRLIQFSRSAATKQCIRCGNFTEANKQDNEASSKLNCILIQDASASHCVCGGLWVLSPLQ